MGQVQNGPLYINYRNSSQKNKAENEKAYGLLRFAKSTLLVQLTFIKLERSKHENFNFVDLLSFLFLFLNVHHAYVP